MWHFLFCNYSVIGEYKMKDIKIFEDRLKFLRQKAIALPNEPGIYIMKDKNENIIYVGKAKVLKNRVSQYFGSQNRHPDKVKKMVSCVYDFEYIITDSEFEALVLECNFIKQYSPKYNILLKDSKGYNYIKITKDKWPRIKECKQKLDDGAIYIGPYTSSWIVSQSVDEALKIFGLPSCNKKFSNDKFNGRPCLNYYIKQCCAPCNGKITHDDYMERLNEAIDFLKGSDKNSVKTMTDKMNKAAENLDFERATIIRDRISALKKIREKQKVISSSEVNQDVIALASWQTNSCFEVFRFSNGKLYDREEFLVGDIGEEAQARAEFLEQYYLMRNNVPSIILLDGDLENKDIIEKWLSERSKKRVKIVVPKKGEDSKLVLMCKNNAMEKLAQIKGRTGREITALEELKDLLGLSKTPKYIEAYDISNLAGSDNVAGMVVFENGRPLKSAYKRFRIKSFSGQDDYLSMCEVINRRFGEYEKHKDLDEGFGRLPDLILLDGGKGHASVVKSEIKKLNIKVPVFGMVKDDKHKTRAIAKENGEISINSKRQVFTLISSIQEEVHRFAISYNRSLRKRRTVSSTLTKINGIGEKRAGILLKYFKTVNRISQASLKELESVPKMTKEAAREVYNYFNK